MPDKLTDSEIVKALECCIGDEEGRNCFDCPLYEIDDCQLTMCQSALDLINRQKAENERLMRDVFTYQIRWAKAESRETKAKAEAYKEFADKMDEKWLCGVLSYAFSDGYAMDNKANIEELSKFLAKKIKELAGD